MTDVSHIGAPASSTDGGGIGHILNDGKPAPLPALSRAEATARAAELANSVEFKNKLYSGDKAARAQMEQIQTALRGDINVIGGDALAAVDRQQEEHTVMGRTRQADWAMREFDIPAEHQAELSGILAGNPVPRALRDEARRNVEQWQRLPSYQKALNKSDPDYANASSVELRRRLGAARILSIAAVLD